MLMRVSKRLSWRASRGLRGTARQRAGPAGVSFADDNDQAHYSCVCGHEFKAGVTSSVRCPRCGTTQPW
jgi:hypothetical protein